ncbi:MAG: AI-2E family transporter [Nannocystaceae bacterium]|nr:AI-2E family transporter [Myxococcales bacterium]
MSVTGRPPDRPSPRRVETLFSLLLRTGRLWGFIAFLGFVVVLFREVVTPFIFAFALAYILGPLISRMERRIGRVGAVILVYLATLGVIAAFVIVFLPALIQDFTRLRDAAPAAIEYVDRNVMPEVTDWVESSFGGLSEGPAGEVAAPPTSELIATQRSDGSWQIAMEGVRLHVEEVGQGKWMIAAPDANDGGTTLSESLRKLVATKSDEYTGMIYEVLRRLIGGVTAFMTKFVITLMLAAFILFDPERILRFVRSLIPQHYRSNFSEILHEMDIGLSGVIRGQFLICAVNGALTYVGLVLIGIKYSFLLAIIAGAFSLIPIFGTIISSIPILLVALVSNEAGHISMLEPLLVLAWIAGIHLLEANVLNPKIIGDAAHMHPIIVIFALLAGEAVAGLTGALLAVPAASIIQTLYLYFLRRTTSLRRDGIPGPSVSMVVPTVATESSTGEEQSIDGA